MGPPTTNGLETTNHQNGVNVGSKLDKTPIRLPDPTIDLNWSDFSAGAFQDVFHQNALSHPERECVVETGSGAKSSHRTFSYSHIDEATNVFANALLAHGLQRGDVVMIYAHRGVDLVVSIVGTLKAGCTFSVLDPAYPPARQIIYLDVARPRALVVIGKASKEAGRVSDLVTGWISENLNLKITIPDLLLQDNGILLGGLVSGTDVLDPYQSRKTEYPGIVIGPDSTPTLSFTSGSEGKPKGVRGRWLSLTYYFPWMSERFDLTSKDRFTMLSGIAHDPIQRDIFTPLFLGASLWVPSKQDIQHERLAEWVRKYQVTVTHLTPAMGQILTGAATAKFPALRRAFFVGDILIKRDVRALTDLGNNVRVINMYGTTETQRAVSFFEILSRNEDPDFLSRIGDVMPAGSGMKDVQLLVVDRSNPNRICEIGEVGEIYVRAGGLSEGYLGADDLNKMKFITNWFVDPAKWVEEDMKRLRLRDAPEPWREFYKGPRDRLYRSGDLGRYNEHGNVECTGRADDQVKIRGFRVELGDIDSNLSQHPLVRENVTLVRRDKDEEKILVSYIVPEMSRWNVWRAEKGVGDREESNDDSMVGMLKRFRALRDDVRDYLKTKVPSYAIPSVFIPLSRMPLNPNGKVDKPALPFPEPSELIAAAARRASRSRSRSRAALSSTEKDLAVIWQDILRVPAMTIEPDQSFFDLGGHSLSAQTLLFRIQKFPKWSGIDIQMEEIYDYPSLREYAGKIDEALDPQGRVLDSEVAAGEHKQDEHYSFDAQELISKLPASFLQRQAHDSTAGSLNVLLTGATGFLGAYILRDLMDRKDPFFNVFALVRAKDIDSAYLRVKQTCRAYGLWSESWGERLRCLCADLQIPQLGLPSHQWEELTNTIDVIIHNGAQVHWVKKYSTLRAANVLSTVSLIDMAAAGKPKQMAFVSSTAVLDTDHYVSLSDKIVASGGKGIPENDDLEGSQRKLTTGYGQSKWVSERLMREAGKRGLQGSIIRPGYVMGDSKTGSSITDDFLVRMLKGCCQVHKSPDMAGANINMVPVDNVASIVVASALYPKTPLSVSQITSHPRLTFSKFLGCLSEYGYQVSESDYKSWCQAVKQHVEEEQRQTTQYEKSNGIKPLEQHALFPLLHFVTSDLPNSSKARELDDSNALAALNRDPQATLNGHEDGFAVTVETIGLYLAYLIDIGFMPAPPKDSGSGTRKIPAVKVSQDQKEALDSLQGRGAVGK